ncbi:DoxX family protein [Microbacterium mangrovi]|uniref:DoxX family protein n=1 Tax=Microbacterium mangrovi TaxID=1348253 RepID=A0A0B2A523_9MICO|nr:DoxX family protein [Microbacterium mangrovi]KHK96849.1 DoxX family protein [Microbacterium mangrovi]
MNTALWAVNVVAAVGFVGTGCLKAFVPMARLRAWRLDWTDDFPVSVVRLLGVTELLGAAGLILPLATGIAPVLAPIAAVGLAVQTSGAISVHVRRREGFAPALVMLVLSIASAVLGFVTLR